MQADDRDRKRAWKAEQKAAARTTFPLLPDAVLQDMFDFVDHTRRFRSRSAHSNDTQTPDSHR